MSTIVVATFMALVSVQPSNSETVHVDQPYIHSSYTIEPPQYVTKTGDDWDFTGLECRTRSGIWHYANACWNGTAYEFKFPVNSIVCNNSLLLFSATEMETPTLDSYDCDSVSTIASEMYVYEKSGTNYTGCNASNPVQENLTPMLARVCFNLLFTDWFGPWRIWFSATNDEDDCYLIEASFETEAECQSYIYPTREQVSAMAFGENSEYPYFKGFVLGSCEVFYSSIKTYDIHPDFEPSPFLCYTPPPVCEFADIDPALEKGSDCNEYCHIKKSNFCDDIDKDDMTLDAFCKDVYNDCKERCRVFMDGGDCVNGEYPE